MVKKSNINTNLPKKSQFWKQKDLIKNQKKISIIEKVACWPKNLIFKMWAVIEILFSKINPTQKSLYYIIRPYILI